MHLYYKKWHIYVHTVIKTCFQLDLNRPLSILSDLDRYGCPCRRFVSSLKRWAQNHLGKLNRDQNLIAKLCH